MESSQLKIHCISRESQKLALDEDDEALLEIPVVVDVALPELPSRGTPASNPTHQYLNIKTTRHQKQRHTGAILVDVLYS